MNSIGFGSNVNLKPCGEKEVVVESDEGLRRETTLEGLSALKTLFDPTPAGSITAGNSCQNTDGASMTLMMSREYADKHGIAYKLVFRNFQVAGCRADEMGVGPTYAIPKLLKRTGLKVDDIGLWEINEAFGVMIVYASEKLGIGYENMNVKGGAIAMGHPYGVTGSRQTGVFGQRNDAAQCALRRGQHVHRRRHGSGGSLRKSVSESGSPVQ